MIMQVYSVFDSAVNAFGVPFFQINDKTAMRSFSFLCSDEQSQVYFSPVDYVLYHIGQFNDENGQLIPAAPTIIMRGHRLQRPMEVENESN